MCYLVHKVPGGNSGPEIRDIRENKPKPSEVKAVHKPLD